MRSFFLVTLLLMTFSINAKKHVINFDQSVIDNNLKIGQQFEKSKFYNKKINFESSGEKTYFLNKNNNQALILDFCCGNSGFLIQRITVTNPNRLAYGRLLNKINVDNFITGNGVFLRMSYSNFIKKMGVPRHKYYDKNILVLKYFTEDQSHPILRGNNMPSYYAIYKFDSSEKLISFEFGFSEP